jgi:signal peptidase I
LKEKDKIDDDKFQKRYNFFDFFSIIPLFFLVMMTINGLFFTIAVIDGASMEPNYHDEDIVIISYMKSIDRDSVIVFEDEKLLIKRVIGMPGDTLRIENNQVWLNGVYIEDTQYQFVYDGVIPEDKYFVLGDNRSNSRDSRDIGLIDKNKIVGVAILDLS